MWWWAWESTADLSSGIWRICQFAVKQLIHVWLCTTTGRTKLGVCVRRWIYSNIDRITEQSRIHWPLFVVICCEFVDFSAHNSCMISTSVVIHINATQWSCTTAWTMVQENVVPSRQSCRLIEFTVLSSPTYPSLQTPIPLCTRHYLQFIKSVAQDHWSKSLHPAMHKVFPIMNPFAHRSFVTNVHFRHLFRSFWSRSPQCFIQLLSHQPVSAARFLFFSILSIV